MALLFGEEASAPHRSASSVSVDCLAEVRQELADLKATVEDLSERVDSAVLDEVRQVKNTVKFTYSKLEGDLDELRASLDRP